MYLGCTEQGWRFVYLGWCFELGWVLWFRVYLCKWLGVSDQSQAGIRPGSLVIREGAVTDAGVLGH